MLMTRDPCRRNQGANTVATLTYTTAIVVIPPQGAWGTIQASRLWENDARLVAADSNRT
jgi:hypothetical protein